MPMMPRNHQVVRILDVLRALARLDGVDLYELAERHGHTPRNVRRDLEALESAGLPLVKERDGKRMRWRVAFNDTLLKVSELLDASHYLALKAAVSQVPLHQGSSLFAALEDLHGRIEQAVGESGRAQLQRIERCFADRERFAYLQAPPDVLFALVDAVAEQRLCDLRYRPPTGQRHDFRVLPLKIFSHDGAAYLLCQVQGRERLHTLHLHRIETLTVRDEHGTPPVDFDAATWSSSVFGVVTGGPPTRYRLRFDAEVAPYIRERSWHPSQALTDVDGGGVLLDFTCGETWEVATWAASWRAHVEVLEPASLRSEFAALGGWLRSTYGSPGPARRRTRP